MILRDIWFISDTHFSHRAILEHQPRRAIEFGTNLDAMDDAFIEGINAYVKPKDLLIHAGDFVWKNSRAGHFRQRLNVKELWVAQGNHDPNSLRRHVSRMETQLWLKYNGRRFVTQHCPMFSWPSREHGVIHLYGHGHGANEEFLNKHFPDRLAMDVGIDYLQRVIGEWRPIHIEEILTILEV